VLPGFVGTDASTVVLRRYLELLGYDAYAWELGRNTGSKAIGAEGEKLVERLRHIHEATGKKVSIVGWSLGGVMARIASRSAPDAVRQVITLGSPFAGTPKATNVWQLYEMISGEKVDSDRTRAKLSDSAAPPPVQATAIWGRADGIAAWQNCQEDHSDRTENIEVRGSHCGLAVNPTVLFAVADRLAQAEAERVPFSPPFLVRPLYPISANADCAN